MHATVKHLMNDAYDVRIAKRHQKNCNIFPFATGLRWKHVIGWTFKCFQEVLLVVQKIPILV